MPSLSIYAAVLVVVVSRYLSGEEAPGGGVVLTGMSGRWLPVVGFSLRGFEVSPGGPRAIVRGHRFRTRKRRGGGGGVEDETEDGAPRGGAASG